MRRFKCDCGSEKFRVNRDRAVVQCLACFRSFSWETGLWTVFSRKKQAIKLFKRVVCRPVEVVQESLGALRKRLGYRKILKRELKKTEPEDFIVFGDVSDAEVVKVRRTWNKYVKELKEKKIILIGCNEHHGKLRGRHIAKALSRDLKSLGFKTKLTWTANRGARLELLEGKK